MRLIRRYSLVCILVVLLLASLLFVAACGTNEDVDDEQVVKVRINNFSPTEVYESDELNLTNCSLLATLGDGSVVTVPITADMISNFNKKQLGEQNVKITYEGFTVEVKITVKSVQIQRISFASLPEHVTVIQGGKIDLSGFAINVHYQTRTIVLDDVTEAMLTGYNTSLGVGDHTAYINYSGFSIPFQVTVLPKKVVKITVKTLPIDRQYFVGTDVELDPTGLVVHRMYDNGSEDDIAYDDYPEEFSFKYDFSYERAHAAVEVTVGGKSTTFDCTVSKPQCVSMTIDVQPWSRGVSVESEIYSSAITNMVEGDSIDWSRGSAILNYNDGTTERISLDSDMIYPYYNKQGSGNDYLTKYHVFNEVGQHIIYLRYGNYDFFTPLHIAVRAKEAYSMRVADSRPADQQITAANRYFVDGQILPVSFLKYNVLYDNGSYAFPKDEVAQWGDIEESMLADDGISTLRLTADESGTQRINFTVDGVTAGFTIKVVPRLATKIRVGLPHRDVYVIGSQLDLAGSYLYREYNDNTFDTISPIPSSYVTVGRFATAGDYTVTVTVPAYDTANNQTTTIVEQFSVKAVASQDYVTSVSIENYDSNTIHEFSTFEAIPFNEMKINVVKNNGASSELIDLTEATILEANEYALGLQEILFRYEGYVFSLRVDIEGRRVSSIEVSTAPQKLVYFIGEDTELDIAGLLVTKVFNDGDRGEQSMFDEFWSFTGYDLTKEGAQNVKVVYDLGDRKFTTSFQIEVVSGTIKSIYIDYDKHAQAFKEYEGDLVLEVSYRDNINLTYVYNGVNDGIPYSEIRVITFNVEYVTANSQSYTVERELKASYISYNKDVLPGTQDSPITDYKDNVTISYGGVSIGFPIHVVGRSLTSIEIFSKPHTLAYAEKQMLDFEGGYIKRNYSDGQYDLLPMTNGYISVSGYDPNYFSKVQGGTSYEQTVTLTYGGKSTSMVVTTYRKLNAVPTLGNSYFRYGDNSEPIVTIPETITGFTVPETSLEYMVNGEWTAVRPIATGSYPVRIIVYENEYYNALIVENASLMLNITKKTILIDIVPQVKTYGDLDEPIVYTIADGELVGNDIIELEFSREEGEDVKYAMVAGQPVLDSYKINVKFKEGQNQNAFYELAYAQVGLTIAPRQADTDSKAVSVTFTQVNNVYAAHYTDPHSLVIYIGSEDIIYYAKDAEGNYTIKLTAPPTTEGDYRVAISDNYAFTNS
ncbi:MAG: hypothetical protein J6V83_03390, partial [Clostridia bacterium]|nr:hypothetical protein [Clostridia bacterium]